MICFEQIPSFIFIFNVFQRSKACFVCFKTGLHDKQGDQKKVQPGHKVWEGEREEWFNLYLIYLLFII